MGRHQRFNQFIKDGVLDESWTFDQTRDDLFKTQLVHFINCIYGEEMPLVPIKMGIDVLELIENIKESNTKRKEVELI